MAQAQHRIAEEYDAAQHRGEVISPADRHSSSRSELNKVTAGEIGISRKIVHEARKKLFLTDIHFPQLPTLALGAPAPLGRPGRHSLCPGAAAHAFSGARPVSGPPGHI